MIEDKKLGVKIAENPEEAYLMKVKDGIKEQIENLEIDIKINKDFLELDLKQKEERLKFIEEKLKALKLA